jgi:hypothetical protein
MGRPVMYSATAIFWSAVSAAPCSRITPSISARWIARGVMSCKAKRCGARSIPAS